MLRPERSYCGWRFRRQGQPVVLHALVAYRKRAPFPYELIAVTVEQGKFKLPIQALGDKIRALGVEWVIREDARDPGTDRAERSARL